MNWFCFGTFFDNIGNSKTIVWHLLDQLELCFFLLFLCPLCPQPLVNHLCKFSPFNLVHFNRLSIYLNNNIKKLPDDQSSLFLSSFSLPKSSPIVIESSYLRIIYPQPRGSPSLFCPCFPKRLDQLWSSLEPAYLTIDEPMILFFASSTRKDSLQMCRRSHFHFLELKYTKILNLFPNLGNLQME